MRGRVHRWNGEGALPQPLVVNTMHATFATNASGDATWTFPTAFPNTLLGYQITDSTLPAALGAVILKGHQSSNKTKVDFRVYDSAGAVIASTNVTVNITAWGC